MAETPDRRADLTRRWDLVLARMAQITRPADEPGNVAVTLERICIAAAGLVDASGAGVSLLADHGGHGFAAASDPSSRQLEELQFTLGEGPWAEAFDTGRPVLVPDLADHDWRRWPLYASAAHDLGVRAVFAFPIRIGASRLGVLDVFRDRTGELTGEQIGQAVTFADVALAVVLDGQQAAPDGAIPAGFDDSFRADVAQAQGMVMVQLGVSITEALVRLRAYAYAQSRPVGEVARDVVARSLTFTEQ